MECNTVTFVSADGLERSFPLEFLLAKRAVIADKVNGEDIADVMGAGNQLWIPGMPAKFFVRDIVEIRFGREKEPPGIPGFVDDGRDFTNRPNIGMRADFTGRVGEPLRFEGWANDFDKRISGIEFSLDGGATWTFFETAEADAERLVQWAFDYIPEEAGPHVMSVRAVNEDGDASPHPAVHSFEVAAPAGPADF